MSHAFCIASTAVIHELLDDEVIAANLDTGIYYSIRQTGTVLWQLLVTGKTQAEIVFVFQQHYPQATSAMIDEFIQQLVAEKLLVPTKAPPSNQIDQQIHWPLNWAPPLFEKYEEMSALLMLDPIHEVDEQGWPRKQEA